MAELDVEAEKFPLGELVGEAEDEVDFVRFGGVVAFKYKQALGVDLRGEVEDGREGLERAEIDFVVDEGLEGVLKALGGELLLPGV